jgi:hypothetical protein
MKVFVKTKTSGARGDWDGDHPGQVLLLALRTGVPNIGSEISRIDGHDHDGLRHSITAGLRRRRPCEPKIDFWTGKIWSPSSNRSPTKAHGLPTVCAWAGEFRRDLMVLQTSLTTTERAPQLYIRVWGDTTPNRRVNACCCPDGKCGYHREAVRSHANWMTGGHTDSGGAAPAFVGFP